MVVALLLVVAFLIGGVRAIIVGRAEDALLLLTLAVVVPVTGFYVRRMRR
jgi:hypothetical protein